MRDANLIWIDEISAEKAEKFLKMLSDKVSQDCKHIRLAIQSRGGSVPVALALANLLEGLSCKITTYNIGSVDSAAIILFASGEERVCSEHALFHLHGIGKELQGVQTKEMLLQALQEIDEDTRRVTQYLEACSGIIAADTWREMMCSARTLSATDALELGLVNKIGEYRLQS